MPSIAETNVTDEVHVNHLHVSIFAEASLNKKSLKNPVNLLKHQYL